MNLNSEQLKSKAHELALTHKVRSGKTASKRIWREIRTDIHELQTFVLNMRGENSDCAQPAGNGCLIMQSSLKNRRWKPSMS